LGWRPNISLPGQLSKASPAIGEFNGRLHMVHLGDSSNDIWYSTSADGYNWTPNVRIPGQKSKASPALATFGGRLHMVHLGDSSNNIWHSTFDGQSWTENVTIPGQKSKASPALATFGGRLHMVHLGDSSNNIWYSQFDGAIDKWLVNVPVPAQASRSSPSLAPIGRRLVMVHIGSNSNSIWASFTDGVPLSEVQLSLKILRVPGAGQLGNLPEWIRSMETVYASWGITVRVVDTEFLELDQFEILDVGSCTEGNTTEEQRQLFQFRRNIGPGVVAAYFVLSTNPPLNGCAAHPEGVPACVVASGASSWTLGHEVGHVLGLSHVDDNDRLMTGNGTSNVTNPPPDLVVSEAVTMAESGYSTEAL
jgi:hypothetical protein